MGIQICISQQRRDQTITTVMDEKYDLKWKTFNEHLVGVFKELGEEGHFADVTLVSDDQIPTKAHKVVLSACSPVLKTLLVNNPHSHPLLYLRGIKQTELQAILKFMYFGETQIFENRINDFVRIAKELEVKEISEEQEESEEQPEMTNYKDQNHTQEAKYDESTELKPNFQEVTTRTIARRPTQRGVANSEGKYSCDQCDASYGRTSHLNEHKRSKHEGIKYSCIQCPEQTPFTRESELKRHTDA